MIKKILQAKVVSGVLLVSLGLVVGGWAWAYFALRGIVDTPLILHFDDLSGINAVGSLQNLMLFGAVGTLIVIVNSFIVLEFEGRDPFLGKLAAAITFIFAALLFIGFAAIINVN